MIREYCDMCNKEVPAYSCKEKSRILFQEYMNERQMVLCKDCYQEIIRDIAITAHRKKMDIKPAPIPMTPTN